MSTLIGLVESGLGLAVVPQLTLPHGSATVIGMKLEQPAIRRTIAIVRRSGRSLSPAAAAFAELLASAGRATQKAIHRRRESA